VVAKNKAGEPADSSSERAQPDILEMIALHDEASRRRAELLKEARALEAAGKKRVARKLLRVAEEIQLRLRALEDQCRGAPGT
jgi:hypothetical protein